MSLWTLLICLTNYACHKGLGFSVKKIHHNIFNALFHGHPLSEIRKQVDFFLEQEFESLIYAPARQKLKLAQENGEQTVILSSSPDFLVGAFARRFGVSEWKATEYSTDDKGHLAHISGLLEGEDKAQYIKSVVEKLNLPFSSITFYTDSFLDLPAMQIVGKPVGVSPDRKLKEMCQKNGWEIL